MYNNDRALFLGALFVLYLNLILWSLSALRLPPIGLYDYFLFQTFGGLEKIA